MSYVTADQYEAYAEARGITINFATLEADIIKSADFIDTYYIFKGTPQQAYPQLPTDQVTIADIERGALKAVELQQAGRLTLDPAALTGGLVESESKSLDGVGSKSVSYVAGSQPTWKPRAPELDLLLRPWLASSGAGLRKS